MVQSGNDGTISARFPEWGGPAPGSAHERYVAARLAEVGEYGTETVADLVARHAADRPDGVAFVDEGRRLTWMEYEQRSTALAAVIVAAGFEPGERLAVYLPDGPDVHVAYVAAEKAGVIVMGIGPRAGVAEVRHLVVRSGATGLLSRSVHRETDMGLLVEDLRADGIPLRTHLVLDDGGEPQVDGGAVDASDVSADDLARRRLGIGDVALLNSTSGTTGLPKCVVHNQNRWFAYHRLAVDAGEYRPDDVCMSLIPAPFGFGLWTSHFTPAILGCPTVVMERFDVDGALRLIERERVTVMACVSTQFIMMLDSPSLASYDLSSLRAMFTGGEAVPYARAAQFEDEFGAKVLQFYGSNETGALSYTTARDDREHRLRTAGRRIEGMDVTLLAEDRTPVVTAGTPGQAGCRGPVTCLGYFDDDDANRELITDDGLMMTGDIVVIDADGYLQVVGRTSDFIIRGGKNVSAVVVEEQVATHPRVAMAAAVSMPDPTFGERVCAYVVLRDGGTIDLEEVLDHLRARGCSKETFPERLEVVPELPRSSGGKVAKAELRADIRRRMGLSTPTDRPGPRPAPDGDTGSRRSAT